MNSYICVTYHKPYVLSIYIPVDFLQIHSNVLSQKALTMESVEYTNCESILVATDSENDSAEEISTNSECTNEMSLIVDSSDDSEREIPTETFDNTSPRNRVFTSSSLSSNSISSFSASVFDFNCGRFCSKNCSVKYASFPEKEIVNIREFGMMKIQASKDKLLKPFTLSRKHGLED